MRRSSGRGRSVLLAPPSDAGMSYILPSMPMVPASGLAAKAATTRRACAMSASDGLKQRLMVATWSGWIAMRPMKPSRRATGGCRRRDLPCRGSRRTASRAARPPPRRRRTGTAHGRPDRGTVHAPPAFRVAHRAERRAEILAAPGQRRQAGVGGRVGAEAEHRLPASRWRRPRILTCPDRHPGRRSRSASR